MTRSRHLSKSNSFDSDSGHTHHSSHRGSSPILSRLESVPVQRSSHARTPARQPRLPKAKANSQTGWPRIQEPRAIPGRTTNEHLLCCLPPPPSLYPLSPEQASDHAEKTGGVPQNTSGPLIMDWFFSRDSCNIPQSVPLTSSMMLPKYSRLPSRNTQCTSAI